MINNSRKIIKNSAILYIRMFVTIIVGLYSSRLVLKHLGDVDYGIYCVVGGIVLVMGFFNTVMITSSHRFITIEIGRGNSNSVNQVFNASLAVHLAIAVLTFLFAETIGLYYIYNYLNIPIDRLADAVFLFQFSLLLAVASIISIPFQALLTAYENFSWIASVNIITSILTLIVAFVLSIDLMNKLRFYGFMMFVINALSSFLYVMYCIKKYRFLKFSLVKDKRLYQQMFSFSAWVMLGAGAAVGKNQGSALLINSFFGPTMNTTFGLSNQVNVQIDQFAQNVNRSAVPQITKSVGEMDYDRMIKLVCSSSKYTFFMMYIVALPILLETEYIMKLWLNQLPTQMALFCRLLLISSLIESMAVAIPSLIQAFGKIKYFQIVAGLLSLLCLPISFLFFKLGYPPYSIIIVYIISSILVAVTNQFLLKYILNFNVVIFIKEAYLKCMYIILATIPLWLIHYFIAESGRRFIFTLIVAELWTILMIFKLGMNSAERSYLKKMLSDVIKKYKWL